MAASMHEHGSRVVLALDFTGPFEKRLRRAEEVLEKTKNRVAAVKLNQQLILPLGLQGLRSLAETCGASGLPLIADIKLNDIEYTNVDAAESLLAHGFDAVIANPFVGREEGLGAVVEKMHSRGAGVILLVYMSHKGSAEGYGLKTEGGKPMYAMFAERARDWGADGVVVSAKSPERIAETRRIVGEGCLIFAPGVGAQGGEAREALRSGADFVIVGRAITESPDPAAAAAGFNEG